MAAFTLRRILQMIPLLLGVTIITFVDIGVELPPGQLGRVALGALTEVPATVREVRGGCAGARRRS